MQKRGSLANRLPSYPPAPGPRANARRSIVLSALVSLAIAGVLAGIGYLAWTFIDNVNENGAAPAAPVITASLGDGESVLLNQQIQLRIEASSGNPVTSAQLFVDGASVAVETPYYSDARGLYIASFAWTPDELGRADLRIVLGDDRDISTEHLIRVDVTDDPSRVASALRLSVVGIEPLQNVYLGQPIRLRASAQSDEPVTRFAILVNGAEAAAAEASLNDQGVYSAALEWTPAVLGAADIQIRAISASGGIPPRELTVSVIEPPADFSAAAAAGDAQESQEESDAAAADGEPAAYARILSPDHQTRITYAEGDRIDLEIGARGTGPLSIVNVYITPIDDLGNLGRSEQIWQRTGTLPPGGEFADTVRNIERLLSGYGWYQFEIVAFTTAGQRFDHRIDLHIVQPAAGPAAEFAEDESAQDEPEEGAAGINRTDLSIVSVAVARDGRGIEVSVINSGAIDRASVPITIIVRDAANGALLARHEQDYELSVGQVAAIRLPVAVSQPRDLLIELEADYDIEPDGNSVATTLQPPDGELTDLAVADALLSDDGLLIITIVNVGTRPVDDYAVLLVSSGGDGLREFASRPDDAAPLAPGRAEVVFSALPHQPPIQITLDPRGEIDQNPDNNRLTFSPSTSPSTTADEPAEADQPELEEEAEEADDDLLLEEEAGDEIEDAGEQDELQLEE